eukprot:235786-Prorocentrum_minimum.AAC.1
MLVTSGSRRRPLVAPFRLFSERREGCCAYLVGQGAVVLDVEAEWIGHAHRSEEVLQELGGGGAPNPGDEDAPVVQQVAPAAVQHLRRQRHRRRHHRVACKWGRKAGGGQGEGVSQAKSAGRRRVRREMKGSSEMKGSREKKGQREEGSER